MTSKLFSAVKTNDLRGENNMPTNSTSGNAVLDAFAKLGAMRKSSESDILNLYASAWREDRLLALKLAFYNRDIRGGQQERRSFRIILKWLVENDPEAVKKNIHLVPEYGRWDDLFVLFDTQLENFMIGYIWGSLRGELANKLLSKWMPREGKKNDAYAQKFMKSFGLSPSEYRHLLAGNTQVVETQMCKNQWDSIKYEHVPSVAMKNYRKAYSKHDPTGFVKFLGDVKKGVKTIHATTLFPSDLVEKVFEYMHFQDQKRDYSGSRMIYRNVWNMGTVPQVEKDTIQALWNALPNWVTDGKTFLPLADVSHSMVMYGGKPSALSVAIALSIYLAERNPSIFKNEFVTFSGKPELQTLKSNDLFENVFNMSNTYWQENTNFAAVFDLILGKAVENKLSPEDMPDMLLVLSDMQFDQASGGDWNKNSLQMIQAKYNRAGYTVPEIVYWNLRDSIGVAAKQDSRGVALVSGYSPSIMKSLFGTIETPLDIMLKTLNSARYEPVTI